MWIIYFVNEDLQTLETMHVTEGHASLQLWNERSSLRSRCPVLGSSLTAAALIGNNTGATGGEEDESRS